MDNTIKAYDESAPLNVFKHNGFYQVGNEIFNFKFNALEYATRTQQSVTWNFNNEVFKAVDWKTPLNIDLRILYRQRAQQLRDKYDYLVLSFSGGSDSTTILKSFINNGIHLDEIICDWPVKHTSNFKVSTDPDPFNHISEWALAIKPMLEYISFHHPNIKITQIDSTEKLLVEDNEHAFTISHMGPYNSTRRYRDIAKRISDIKQTKDNAAVIMGCDKPQIHIEKNVICTQFFDQHAFFKTSWDLHPRTVEYFYWTPDFPEIVREQCHAIYQHLLSNPGLVKFFDYTMRSVNKEQFQIDNRIKDNIVRQVIYPDWDLNIFQADKAESLVYSRQHSWIMKERTVALEAWENVLQARTNLIDPKYLIFFKDSNKVHTIKMLTSRLYPIGMLPKNKITQQ